MNEPARGCAHPDDQQQTPLTTLKQTNQTVNHIPDGLTGFGDGFFVLEGLFSLIGPENETMNSSERTDVHDAQ